MRDFIVNLQGDAPFTPPAHIAALIDNAAQGRCGDAGDPAVVGCARRSARAQEDDALFGHHLHPRARRPRHLVLEEHPSRDPHRRTKLRKAGGLSPVLQHVGLYGYRREALARIARLPPSRYEELEGLEQLRFLENGLTRVRCRCRGIDASLGRASTRRRMPSTPHAMLKAARRSAFPMSATPLHRPAWQYLRPGRCGDPRRRAHRPAAVLLRPRAGQGAGRASVAGYGSSRRARGR